MQEAFSIEDIKGITGLGKTKIYEMLKDGNLKAKKIGTRTIVLKSDLETFLVNLENYPTAQNKTINSMEVQ